MRGDKVQLPRVPRGCYRARVALGPSAALSRDALPPVNPAVTSMEIMR
jgi:hypothetical protein